MDDNRLHGRFCVGDKFYLCDNKILCEYDYEERLLMTSLEFPNKRSSLQPQQVPCPLFCKIDLTVTKSFDFHVGLQSVSITIPRVIYGLLFQMIF